LDTILNDENLETTTSSENDVNFNTEVKQEEEKVSFEEKSQINSIQKIGLIFILLKIIK
jgi:hypothetical protein